MTATSKLRSAGKANLAQDDAPRRKSRPGKAGSVANPPHHNVPAPKATATASPPPASSAEVPVRATKLAQLIALLEGNEGATLEAMCQATGWRPHSVRGALAGTLRRKGLVVHSSKPEAGPRRYRIGDAT
jgi:hypothetical protein